MGRITNFSVALRRILDGAKKRVSDLAQKAGTTHATLWGYRNGRNRPSVRVMEGIVKALPPATARELVEAHLRDETPEPLRHALRISWLSGQPALPGPPVDEPEVESKVAEQELEYGVARAMSAAESLDAAEEELRLVLQWMGDHARKSKAWRKWLIETYHIMQ